MPRTFLEGPQRLLNIVVEGYATLNRRLWVLVIPIGLDLFLWLGPRISLRRLLEPFFLRLQQVPAADPASLAVLQEWGNQLDLVGLLATPLTGALVPRLANPARPVPSALDWSPTEVGTVLLLGLVAAAVLLLFWSLYLLPLADLARGSGERGLAMLRRVPRAWWRIAALAGLALLAGATFFIAVVVIAALAQLLNPGLAVLVMGASGAALLWLVIFLYLAPYAILLSGVGPLQAVAYSVQVTRYRLWRCLGFFLLAMLVRAGTAALWERLAGHPLGVLLGILANGYVVGGLAAAGLVFYREQLRAWLSRGRQEPGKVL